MRVSLWLCPARSWPASTRRPIREPTRRTQIQRALACRRTSAMGATTGSTSCHTRQPTLRAGLSTVARLTRSCLETARYSQIGLGASQVWVDACGAAGMVMPVVYIAGGLCNAVWAATSHQRFTLPSALCALGIAVSVYTTGATECLVMIDQPHPSWPLASHGDPIAVASLRLAMRVLRGLLSEAHQRETWDDARVLAMIDERRRVRCETACVAQVSRPEGVRDVSRAIALQANSHRRARTRSWRSSRMRSRLRQADEKRSRESHPRHCFFSTLDLVLRAARLGRGEENVAQVPRRGRGCNRQAGRGRVFGVG